MQKIYKAGSNLFHENDRSRELYVIQSGSVKVYRKLGSRDVELAILGKGAVLGEMALIDGKPRSASAKALEDSCVILIDSESFHTKIKGVPTWFMSIIKMISQKIRQANRRLQSISSSHQEINIIISLNYFFISFDKNGEGIDIKNTQHQIIQLLGVTQQKVIHVLEFLQKNGFIEIKDEKILNCNKVILEQYCDFLRSWMRKQFLKTPPLTDPMYSLMATIFDAEEKNMTGETPVTEMDGKTFWKYMEKTSLATQVTEFFELLKEHNLITYSKTKESSEKSECPIDNYIVKINNKNWKNISIYGKYKDLIPLL